MVKKSVLMLLGSVCLILMLLVSIMTGCAAQAPAPAPAPAPTPAPELPTVQWDLFNWDMAGTYSARTIGELLDKISSRTDGKFQITGYYGGTALGFDQGDIQYAIRDQVVQIGAISLGGASGVIPWFGIFQRPFLCSWPDQLYQLSDAVFPVFERELAKMNITPITFFCDDPQHLWTIPPAEDVTDLKDMKVRTWDEATSRVTEAMGASPTLLSFQEVYLALQLGTVQGVVTGANGVLAGSLFEFVKHGYLVGVSTPTFYIAYNNEAFELLPSEYKTILLEEIEKWSEDYYQGIKENYGGDLTKLEEEGVQLHELSDEDRRVIADRLIPDWQNWADAGGPTAKELLDIALKTLGY